MGPKFDPNEVKYIFMRAVGGEVGAASALAPKVGPMGLSPKKVGEAIRDATMDWKGLKITVCLSVKNRQATPSVIPSASSLIVRALYPNGIPEADGDNRVHDGDVSYDDIYEVAKVMRKRSMARTMAGTVKEMLGTAFSIGCTVDGEHPRDIIEQIDDGERTVEDYEAPKDE